MRLAPAGANPNRAAFTLLEVLVVFAVVAILAALGLGAGARAIEAGKKTRAVAELAAMAAALDAYKQVHGDFPRTDDPKEMARLLSAPQGADTRVFLETSRLTLENETLIDPWGSPYGYAYKVPAAGWVNPRFVLFSPGADRIAFSRLTSGGFPDRTVPENLDNVYAGQN